MIRRASGLSIASLAAAMAALPVAASAAAPRYDDIQTIVVIYAENRSFDNLYGTFPGANGLAQASAASATQLDRDGKPMRGPAGGLGRPTDKVFQGAPVAPIALTEGQTATFLGSFNHPYDVASLYQSAASEDNDPLRYTTATCITGSTRTRCRSTAAPTTCSPPGRIPAA